jgi:hypothetical protein
MIAGIRALRAAEQTLALVPIPTFCVFRFPGMTLIDHEVGTIRVSGWDNDVCQPTVPLAYASGTDTMLV